MTDPLDRPWREHVGDNLVGLDPADRLAPRAPSLPAGPTVDYGAVWLGSPNYTRGRPDRVLAVVLHTMVGTWQAANARFQRASEYASAHFGVCLDGSLKQWVDVVDTAWHCGDWWWNQRSIGIEHEDAGDYNGPRTPALYQRSHDLLTRLAAEYQIPLTLVVSPEPGIFGHRVVAATACPDALDLERIVIGGEEMDEATVRRIVKEELQAVLAKIDSGFNETMTVQHRRVAYGRDPFTGRLGIQDPGEPR